MLEAENNIIGEMLFDTSIIPEVASILKPEMFESNLNREIFTEIVKADNEGVKPDTTYIISRIDHFGEDEVRTRITEAVAGAPTSFFFQTDIKTIYDSFLARDLAKKIRNTEITPSNVYDVISGIDRYIDKHESVQTTSRTASEITQNYKDRYFKKRDRPLLKTGYDFIDSVTGGLEEGDVIAIGARPAVGKTAFAMQLAIQISENGFKVQMFNLEMTEKQIYERLISYWAQIPLLRLRTAEQFQNVEEQFMFDEANKKLADTKNLIVSSGSKSVNQIRAEVIKVKPDIVIIDYLQLIKSDSFYKGNRYAEVGAISHSIKALAIEMKIPIVILTQLNRLSEGKKDKEPTMGEIRESGDIEQDTSIIILLWNKDEDDRTRKGCKIEKNRNGTLDTTEITFNGSKMRFEDNGGFIPVTKEIEEELPFIADEG